MIQNPRSHLAVAAGGRRRRRFRCFAAAICLAAAGAASPAAAQEVVRFLVVDADTDQIINDIGSGTTLATDEIGPFNIVARTDPDQVGSVVFELDGAPFATDNIAPYALGEEIDGDFLPVEISAGTHSLVATPFTLPNAGGAPGAPLEVTFTISNEVGARSDFEAEAEVEAESEVEAEVAPGVSAGASSQAAAAAASGNNAIAETFTSGSLSLTSIDPAMADLRPVGAIANSGHDDDALEFSQTAPEAQAVTEVKLISAEAEAEAEVESEVEVETGRGSAAAAGGTAGSAAAVGTSIFLFDDGSSRPMAGDTETKVESGTSTATSTSRNFLPMEPLLPARAPIEPYGAGSESLAADFGNGAAVPDAKVQSDQTGPYRPQPVLQLDTEAEVEAEAEAEAEAESDPGSAGAAATGGAAVAVAGDFAAVDTEISLATSASTSDVTEPTPALFTEEEGDPAALSATDSRSATITGKGLFEAESEAEAEAEAEAEVDNNAASAAAVATGGGGSAGLASTARASASTSASTSTELNQGKLVRQNDVVDHDRMRFEGTVPFEGDEAEAEAKSAAEAEADILEGVLPLTGTRAGNFTLGDATAEAKARLDGSHSSIPGGTLQGVTQIDERHVPKRPTNGRGGPSGGGQQVGQPGNLEIEIETEAEVEAEAETGFNAAAASASAVAVQAENGFIPTPAEAASATSTSTSVFDGHENRHDHVSFPGPAPEGARGGVPVPDIDPSALIFEVETEAEAEAEVGFMAAATAASAASAGSETLDSDTLVATTPFAAAAAAAAGAEISLRVVVPPEDEAGHVTALASASDPDCLGVAVAVAVAGVPTEPGIDNESEEEAEGLCEATVEVSVRTDPANAETPVLLDRVRTPGGSEGEPEGVASSLESESEAEAEAEAEADYGVAAAAAGAASAGMFSDVSAKSETATRPYDGPYDFVPENLPPVAVLDRVRTGKKKRVRIKVLANDYDPEGDPIRVVRVKKPVKGRVKLHGNGTVVYKPFRGAKGKDRFKYVIKDSAGNKALGRVRVRIGRPIALTKVQ